jgi:hypothetical protein
MTFVLFILFQHFKCTMLHSLQNQKGGQNIWHKLSNHNVVAT